MTNIHFAAALFPQHTKSGADAVLTAADNAATQTQRLQRFRTQVAELLGIPANAEDGDSVYFDTADNHVAAVVLDSSAGEAQLVYPKNARALAAALLAAADAAEAVK
ncbi:hypothetical protein [Mycobacterium sp. TY815]|uniref:hypothetical protein n=1 Tax=Mycobacterium sp. TY815 TaxID=3050581 RepID=UPI0027404638|nr:hypothetical protein [Mycobacterium sp. TY815]MDP7703213.1 hypothetical protein [Mycobacterium sp. TY815]